MSRSPDSSEESDSDIRDAAARWVVRRDRTLSQAESVEFEAWLAADERHAAEFARSVASWGKVRQIGAAVRRADTRSRQRRGRRIGVVAAGLAAAVAVMGFNAIWQSNHRGKKSLAATEVGIDAATATSRKLSDGSTVRLKAGADVVEEYSAGERRLRLARGVVFFEVAKDETRPFLVQIGGTTVRAVGTAFSVDAQPEVVNVLVTEGTVRVTAPGASSGGAVRASELVTAGHRAIVAQTTALPASAITVTAVSPPEIAWELAWRGSMLDFAGATLGELAAAFGERSGRRITIADPALASVRIGGQFPTDDVEGFLRAIEEAYAIKVEHRSDGSVVLSAR